MCNPRAFRVVLFSALVALHCGVLAQVSAQGSNVTSQWQTLSGDPPFVVARGGFSGLFPDSSLVAYNLALMTSVPDVILWCDVQLTKDGVGICFPDLRLDNGTNIPFVFKNQQKKYLVNGVLTSGWFSIDYTLNDLVLGSIMLTQGVYGRTNKFDGNVFPILTVQDITTQLKPPGLWLNIQHDAFYTQHNLSMRSLVLSVSRSVIVSYISSPEVSYLRSITTRLPSTTKLVFRFLGQNEIEPTTNQTYGSLLKNLTFIKSFASGILVPKDYIWPVQPNLYLLPHTSVVMDAHKAGLEVFASTFVNDLPISYNYSYDPIAEYLSFIDNGEFSVDGVLSDFPITPSEAIDCFSHLGKNASKQVNLLVISKNGASGDYPSCTDLAYQKAISDGVDVIDCPVQMSKDGIPFCLSSVNLIDSTNAVQSEFSNRTTTIPEIMAGSGIFSFSLSWDEIQTLIPQISAPQHKYRLLRNPNYKTAGKFVKLSDFLDMAKNASSLSGFLISIENAAYLAEKQGMGITDAVIEALGKAGFDNQTALNVIIQSTSSAVLMKLKEKNNYELVFKIEENIRDAPNGTIEDIKKFADSVVLNKDSVFPENALFLTSATRVVSTLQSFKLQVYIETFSNEFVSQAWDFFSDATVEINSFYMGAGINGVITDFPKTADRYRRNVCLNKGEKTPIYMSPVEPGSLMQLITPPYMPPAEAPNPLLTEADVVEPPLPLVTPVSPASQNNSSSAPSPKQPNGQPKVASAGIFLSSMAMLLVSLLLL